MDKNTKTTKKRKKRHSIFGNLVFLLADIFKKHPMYPLVMFLESVTFVIMPIFRMYEPTSGQITLNGIDIGKYDYDEYMRIFAVVFQDFKLFNFPLDENIAGSEKVDDKRVEEVLKKVGLTERVARMRDGVHTCIDHESADSGT